MILGWQSAPLDGHCSVGRYVLVDALFPWPALHYGRNAMRDWAAMQSRRRNMLGAEGPVRVTFGLTTAVKEDGQVELRIWPVGKAQMPRDWTPADTVWREPLKELRRAVAADLACETRLEFMPGGNVVTRAQTVPSLRGVPGFWGWRRGEREPTAKIQRSLSRQLIPQLLGPKPAKSGELRWL